MFLDLLEIQRADAAAQAPHLVAQKHAILREVEQLYFDIEHNREPYLIQHQAVNGNDLLKAGVQQKQIGTMLHHLLETVIINPTDNTGDFLLKEVKKYE